MTRKALGRGLGALIPGPSATTPEPAEAGSAVETVPPDGAETRAPAAADLAGGVRQVPLDRITPNPKQPRLDFDAESLAELAESIRAQGVLQPILIRPAGHGYELVAGERRLRAARQVGLQTIPAIVRAIADDELLEVALIENLQRDDLNAIEEALGYQRLIDELRYTHERLSERLGKSRVAITNALRLLTLPEAVRVMVSRGTLTAGHGRALLGLPSHAEIEANARYVVDMGFSVRKTEALVARKLRRKTAARRTRNSQMRPQGAVDAVSSAYEEWTNRLRRHFSTQVRILQQGERGQVEIEYYSESDLERLLELMGVTS
jgi:ParB family chromosome partitioning protein